MVSACGPSRTSEIQRDLIGDADSVTVERNNLFGVIGKDADVVEAEVDENLRADAAFVLNHTLASGFAIELTSLMKMNLRKVARRFRSIDTEASPGVMEVEENAAVFLGDGFQRARDEFGTVAGDGAKNVPGKAVGVNANQRRRGAGEVATN